MDGGGAVIWSTLLQIGKRFVKATCCPLGSRAVDFGTHLDELLQKRDLTQSAFSRLVGVSPHFLGSIRRGQRKLPPQRVEHWADALGLKGAERRDFLLIAMLPKCPEVIRPYIVKLIGQR